MPSGLTGVDNMTDKTAIEKELERATEVYPLLLEEVQKTQKEIVELKQAPDKNSTELYIKAQKLARYSADLVAIDTEIEVLCYVLGKGDLGKLPSQRYDIREDGKLPSERDT